MTSALLGWAFEHAGEMDGELVLTGRRLRNLTAVEVLNLSHALILRGLDPKQREEMNAHLDSLGKGARVMVDDDLPPSLRGKVAPAWWSDAEDPFDDTFTVE